MIVKIWPIKASYSGAKGKVGGWKGVKNAQKYIEDDKKVIVAAEENLCDIPVLGKEDVLDSSFINTEKDFHRVVDYMANEDKTKAKYVSTYLCKGDDVTLDFRLTAERMAVKSKGKVNPDTGAMAFHIVQSFPEGLDISDEEVHECGLELVKRLEKYQALVCSHVHPVVDDDGKIHGKSKHNHILICAFMHPGFYDPEKGGPRKYHDSKETYKQLQIINDEIAMEHGLPIIRNPDQDRIYTWHETNEKNQNTSWKERVRIDIERYRRAAKSWNEFVKIMRLEGYEVKEKTHVTYTTPDGNKVRDNTLGQRFTKNSLELYWAVRDHQRDRIKKELEENEDLVLSEFVCNYGQNLSAKIPLGPNQKDGQASYFLPLNKDIKANEEALRSYMEIDQLYDICDESGLPVAAASGLEILQSIEDLRDEDFMRRREEKRLSEQEVKEERKRREREKEEEKRKEYYTNQQLRNSRTGALYRTGVYDEDGRRRTAIELIVLLALIVLDKEEYLWTLGELTPNQEHEEFFASTNWKAQQMIDAIEIARLEDLDTPSQLEKRMKVVGADLSRAKKAHETVSRTKERMDPVANAIADYKRTRKLSEGIASLPEGAEKDKLQEEYADVIEEYKAAKHALYIHKIVSEAEINDFDIRYEKIQHDMNALEERKRELSEHYRRLKTLNYSLQRAEDPQFLYGPAYSVTKDHTNDNAKEERENRDNENIR